MAIIRIGTAGWQLPKSLVSEFPATGTHLQRYSVRFGTVEVNSTFYRLPRPTTAMRWAASVPPRFRFALKMPKAITHDAKLRHAAKPLAAFLELRNAFGPQAGPVLMQLPPKLEFSAAAEDFLHQLHEHDQPHVVVEPRHPSWFTTEVDDLLRRLGIARVAADPPRAETDGRPGGSKRMVYFRWHGRPRIYWSSYGTEDLAVLSAQIKALPSITQEAYVIFDNTAQGFATGNALELMRVLPAMGT